MIVKKSIAIIKYENIGGLKPLLKKSNLQRQKNKTNWIKTTNFTVLVNDDF